MIHDVFISYAREDRTVARKVADALLAARGWSVWWDTGLRPGEQFPRRIQEAVAASRCVVVLWSHQSTASDWVVAEASEGWNRRVLVPVTLDDSEPPMPFRQTQSRDLSQWRGQPRDATLLALVEDIGRVHAQGAPAGDTELAERERRRRSFLRRRLLRRVAMAVVVATIAAGGGFLWRQVEMERSLALAAEDLARKSDTVRAEVVTLTPEQEKRIWWVHLFEDNARLDRLELSVLLAIEGLRRRHTDRTERSLRDALALVPWSDRRLEIEHQDAPLAIHFNGNGRLLAAGGGIRGTFIWDLERDTISTRIAHGGTGGKDRWEDKRGRYVDGRGSRQVLDFNPKHDVVATAGPDSTARIWDAHDGHELLRLPHAEMATAVAFDAKGERLATSDESGAVCLWDSASGKKLHCMAQGSPVYWVAFSPSSALLASVGLDGSVDVWDTATGERRRQFRHEGGVKAARFDPHEKMLATFGDDTDTRLWNLENGTESWRIQVASSVDAGVVFDGATHSMVVAGNDGTITWWNTDTRAERFSVPGQFVVAMSASTDRRRLVTIDSGREARAWDLDSGRLLKRMPYYQWLNALAISPDGEFFATGGQDDGEHEVIEVTRIWPRDPVAAACAKLSRNLTRTEWNQYLGDEPYRPTCANIKRELSRNSRSTEIMAAAAPTAAIPCGEAERPFRPMTGPTANRIERRVANQLPTVPA